MKWSLWEEILKFNDRHFPDWKDRIPIFYTNAIAGEVGELCNLTKKMAGGGTNRASMKFTTSTEIQHMVAVEVFDILVYCVLMLGSMGVHEQGFALAAQAKLKELYQRMGDEMEE